MNRKSLDLFAWLACPHSPDDTETRVAQSSMLKTSVTRRKRTRPSSAVTKEAPSPSCTYSAAVCGVKLKARESKVLLVWFRNPRNLDTETTKGVDIYIYIYVICHSLL